MQRTSNNGFTVPELIVAIVVATIMMVGVVVILVNLSGTGASSIVATTQVRESQTAMDTIKQDVSRSTRFLIEPTIVDGDESASPSGNWQHVGSGEDQRTLILELPATDKPIQNPDKQLIYLESNGCPIGHDPVQLNVIYFVKNSTLYRRTLIPDPVPGDPYCGGASISQHQTCTTPGTPTKCSLKDVIVAENVTSFNVHYYLYPDDAEPAESGGEEVAYDDDTPINQTTLDSFASIRISLSTEANIDGKMKEHSSSLRLMRTNF